MSSTSSANDKNYTDNESDSDEYMTFRLELGDTFEEKLRSVRHLEKDRHGMIVHHSFDCKSSSTYYAKKRLTQKHDSTWLPGYGG